jgi:hypothetical protein
VPAEIADVAGLQRLFEALKRHGYDDALLEKRRLASVLRMERRRAQQELRRRGGDDGMGPSNAQPCGQ